MRPAFRFDTVKEFDGHISASVFGYDVLHALIRNIASFYLKEGTVPIDIGCTTGKLLKAIEEEHGVRGIGYDISPAQFIPGLDLRVADVTASDFEIPPTNLVLSVFTLQFLPVEKRPSVLAKIYRALHTNGALVICEKEIASSGAIQEVFTFANYSRKLEHFTAEEVLEKERALRPVMNPLGTRANVMMLRESGFEVIEPFFQSLNFKGYLCKK